MYFFESQTKLIFSSSNPNNFYVLTFYTITDKCTLVRELCELFQQGFLSYTRLPLPIRKERVLKLCRYLIPNDWKQIIIFE